MNIDRVSDIVNLIEKGAHVIIDAQGHDFFYNRHHTKLHFSIDDLKVLVRTATNSNTTITIRNAIFIDIRVLEELLSIGDKNIVLDFVIRLK